MKYIASNVVGVVILFGAFSCFKGHENSQDNGLSDYRLVQEWSSPELLSSLERRILYLCFSNRFPNAKALASLTSEEWLELAKYAQHEKEEYVSGLSGCRRLKEYDKLFLSYDYMAIGLSVYGSFCTQLPAQEEYQEILRKRKDMLPYFAVMHQLGGQRYRPFEMEKHLLGIDGAKKEVVDVKLFKELDSIPGIDGLHYFGIWGNSRSERGKQIEWNWEKNALADYYEEKERESESAREM